jgi:predicted O-methyltransferase YrrM
MPIRKYLKEKGFTNFEGSLYYQKDQQDLLKELIQHKKRGLEIGFNAGDSADLFLNQGCDLISFDIGRHSYIPFAKDYLDHEYPEKHQLVIGDSTKTIPEHNGEYDFIYIDGNHSYKIARQDLANCRKLSHKDTLIIIDDYVCNPLLIRKWNTGVIEAVNELEDFEVEGQRDLGIGRGLIWGKYV